MKDSKFHLKSSLTTTLPGICTQRSRLSKMFHLICVWVMTSSEFLRSGTWRSRTLQVLQNEIKKQMEHISFSSLMCACEWEVPWLSLGRWCSVDKTEKLKLISLNSDVFFFDKSFPFSEPLVSISFGKLLVFKDRIDSWRSSNCKQTIISQLVS